MSHVPLLLYYRFPLIKKKVLKVFDCLRLQGFIVNALKHIIFPFFDNMKLGWYYFIVRIKDGLIVKGFLRPNLFYNLPASLLYKGV